MSSPRERQLAAGIKNMLIAIQRSEQIFIELAWLREKMLHMDRKEKIIAANSTALKVEKYVRRTEKKTGNRPASPQIKKKVEEELKRI